MEPLDLIGGKDEYKAILTEFSERFVVGFDYGGGQDPLPLFLKERAKNVRGLPEQAQHDIGYRNAWRLLTGKAWE